LQNVPWDSHYTLQTKGAILGANSARKEFEGVEKISSKKEAAFMLAKDEIEILTNSIDDLLKTKQNKHKYMEVDPSGSRYETLCDCFNRKKELCVRILQIELEIESYNKLILKIIKKEPEIVANKLSKLVEKYDLSL